MIPAYNPDERLKSMIQQLQENGYAHIVVINDGSLNHDIFKELEHNVIVLEHENNQGKGMAIKTGMHYCREHFQDNIGIITIDADGQHSIEDINNIYHVFLTNEKSIILGSRNFYGKNVPFQRKIGNLIFSHILERKMKKKIQDTQTGLRAIPFAYLQEFEQIRGDRYEYETNMLIYCIKNQMDMLEVDIQTIYKKGDHTSHFKGLRDSFKICQAVMKS